MLRLHQELQPHLDTYMYIPSQDLCWIHDGLAFAHQNRLPFEINQWDHEGQSIQIEGEVPPTNIPSLNTGQAS